MHGRKIQHVSDVSQHIRDGWSRYLLMATVACRLSPCAGLAARVAFRAGSGVAPIVDEEAR